MKSDLRVVYFVRTDLSMTKGKMCAQVGHATQYLVGKEYLGVPSKIFLEWFNNDSIKICLKVNSEEELLNFYTLGKNLYFNTELVIDKGFTQFNNEETKTVVSWGPILKSQHEAYTAHLRLL